MLQKGYCIVELTYLYKASGLKVNLLHWHKLIGIVKKTLLKILPHHFIPTWSPKPYYEILYKDNFAFERKWSWYPGLSAGQAFH